MARLVIHGRLDPTPVPPALARAMPPGSVTPRHSARLESARAGRPPHALELADDDLIEIELEGGMRLWTRADDLRRDYGAGRSRDAGDDATVRREENTRRGGGGVRVDLARPDGRNPREFGSRRASVGVGIDGG